MMNYPEKIDLHMHSTVSDGTDDPIAILELVKRAGIGLFSLTDHDSIKGSVKLLDVLAKDPDTAEGVHFLPGIEFSCKDELGKYHILGYNYDARTKPIREIVDKGHTFRMAKLKERLDFLKEEYGFVFSKDDLIELYSKENPGKPHVGNLMVKYGFAPTKEIAIREYINKKRIKNQYIRPEEAIEGILGSGGIPVLAHPAYGDGDQTILGNELKERVKRLIGFGLKGVEAFYSGFVPKTIGLVLRIARDNDLYVTAGSDYHGSNKLVVLGDTNFKGEWPKGLIRFLQDTGIV